MCAGLLSGRGDFLEEVFRSWIQKTSGIIQPEHRKGGQEELGEVLLGGERGRRWGWEAC